jgi:diaminopimelate epimerase
VIQVTFYKFHGTGNDFIMIDNREYLIRPSKELVALWCHRRFGIGADGLILLENDAQYDFRMQYYNSDGNTGSMCGNGGRCVTAFAGMLDLIDQHTNFIASDGQHQATINTYDDDCWNVSLEMQNVHGFTRLSSKILFLDTGSPHYIKWVDDVDKIDVLVQGKEIRNSDEYKKYGVNVNFISENNNATHIRTYERGVESETWSCGTGAVAAAIAGSIMLPDGEHIKKLTALGGNLQVSFVKKGKNFSDIILQGDAHFIFKGVLNYSGA